MCLEGPISEETAGNEDDDEAELNALSNQPEEPTDVPSAIGGNPPSGYNSIPVNYDGL